MRTRSCALTLCILVSIIAGCSSQSASHSQRRDQIILQDTPYGQRAVGYFTLSPRGGAVMSLNLGSANGQVGLTRGITKVAWLAGGDPDRYNVPSSLWVSAGGSRSPKQIWKVGDDSYGGPAWSPDGSKLALALYPLVDRGGLNAAPATVADAGLWVINASGNGKRKLLGGTFYQPSWSPNDKEILFIAQTGDRDLPAYLETIPATGGDPTVLVRLPPPFSASLDVKSVSWSPDSKTILLTYWVSGDLGTGTDSGIESFNVATGTFTVVAPATKRVAYIGATYSPDGTQIAVLTRPQLVIAPLSTSQTTSGVSYEAPAPPNYTVEIGNADGSNLTPVASVPNGVGLVGWF